MRVVLVSLASNGRHSSGRARSERLSPQSILDTMPSSGGDIFFVKYTRISLKERTVLVSSLAAPCTECRFSRPECYAEGGTRVLRAEWHAQVGRMES